MIRNSHVAVLALLALSAAAAQTQAPDPAAFADPPISARPRAYWDWINGAVELDQLTRDLEAMRAVGMGGAQMWDTGALRNPDGMVPAGPPFMGTESVAAVRHALAEAGRLGLELGLLTSSGWNAGGAWVTPEMAGKNLYYTETVVEGPGTKRLALPLPPLPEHCPRNDTGEPLYMRDVALLAFPDNADKIIARSGIRAIATPIQDGAVEWEAPNGRWRVMRFVCLNNGQHLIAASPNSNGLMIDFLDPDATVFHFHYILDSLGITPENSAAIGLRYLAVESMELEEGIQWTDAFASYFQRSAGYEIEPWLPVLAGWTIDDAETSERFRYDYRNAVSDRLIFSHYTTGNELLDRYGIALSGEAGGPGPPIWNSCPVDALKALGNVDIPQGEFWIRHRNMSLVKEISSAAHIYGKPLVDAEAFTTWRRWKDGPAVLKRYADRAFCEGLNRVTYHTFASSPPEAGYPGRVYHAGVDLNPRVTWWSMARPFMDYLARCSYMLQQGQPVADVCYYYGDQASNFWPPFHDVPEKPLLDGLGAGYDYDVVNADVILNRMSVRDGRIVLPDGMSYAIMQLCDRARMPLEMLEKIEELIDAGATILGPKPLDVPGLKDHAEHTAKLRALADALWDSGRIDNRTSARECLESKGIAPDFSYTSSGDRAELDYIHRTAGDTDIYFVRNSTESDAQAMCTFRVREKRPMLWNPVDGSIAEAPRYQAVDDTVHVHLTLPEGGSVFVVFEPAAELKRGPIHEPEATHSEALVDGPWDIRFPEGWGAPPETTFEVLHDWTEDENEGIRYFSGIATYQKTLDVPPTWPDENVRLSLALGEVRDVARVRLNGHDLGVLWTPPFTLDITDTAVPGANTLEIDVANMWINRLTGDLDLPLDKRFTSTNATPPNRDLGGDEFWRTQPSGLLGPVVLVSEPNIDENE